MPSTKMQTQTDRGSEVVANRDFSDADSVGANQQYRQLVSTLNNQTMPFAWLDLDAINENCRHISALTSGKKVRIVTKSIRSPNVLRFCSSVVIIFMG